MKKSLILAWLTITLGGFSQEKTSFFSIKEQKIGVQINPYFTDILYPKNYGIVSAMRYSVENSYNLAVGSEVGMLNYFYENDNTSLSIQTGVFLRYTFFIKHKIRPFFETQGYYEWVKNNYSIETHYFGYKNNTFFGIGFNYYLAPGIEFFLYKQKISMDLLVKLTHTNKLIGGNNAVPSFKINYHF
ncbi:MAG: hypothetical protein JEZ09_20235 [Salinivirgaceae bacterium]|nr:hypothetical protein [Salinivirgaceae bacterium]